VVKRRARANMREATAHVEVAVSATCPPTGARGDGDAVHVFESPRLEITVSPTIAGTCRLDGWLAPPLPYDVTVVAADGIHRVTSDVLGRFVVAAVARGPVTVTVHIEPGPPVATPEFDV